MYFLVDLDTEETIEKYGSLRKLRNLIHTIAESQSTLLDITSAYLSEFAKKKEYHENQVSELTQKVYERCATCDGVLYRARLEHVRDEVELRFKNAYSYFMHDIDEINRLEE